ncbi:MAG: hypothetical protein AB1714_04095 [Acidobacteriota bacterium]
MTKPSVILCLAVTLAPIVASGAQRDQQRPVGGDDHRPPPPPIVSVLDVNRDALIEAAEIAEASTALLKLDRNKDGELTRDEYAPPRPLMRRGESDEALNRPPAPRGENDDNWLPQHRRDGESDDNPYRPRKPPIDCALDSDGDGNIGGTEIAAAPASLRKLDSNGDGALTPDEFMGLPSQQDPARSDPGSGRD